MSPALSLTRDDLVRALTRLSERPAVDLALRGRADALAREVEAAAADGTTARVARRGPGDYVVTVSGPGLFARELGSPTREADPIIAEAIARGAGHGS